MKPFDGVLYVLGDLEGILAALAAWTFVAIYSRVNWRFSGEGRHLMRMTLMLAVLFTLVVIFRYVPIPRFDVAVVRVVVFGGISFEIIHLVRLLWNSQKAARALRKGID